MKSLILLIAALATTIACHAETLTVNPDGSAEHTNLSQALQQAGRVGAAREGDQKALAGLERRRLPKEAVELFDDGGGSRHAGKCGGGERT